eukprot:3293497-Pleurochrysis_carterae.AAC.1
MRETLVERAMRAPHAACARDAPFTRAACVRTSPAPSHLAILCSVVEGEHAALLSGATRATRGRVAGGVGRAAREAHAKCERHALCNPRSAVRSALPCMLSSQFHCPCAREAKEEKQG